MSNLLSSHTPISIIHSSAHKIFIYQHIVSCLDIMPRSRFGNGDVDFEDMLFEFEKKFSQCERGKEYYQTKFENIPSLDISAMSPTDFEPELRTLWQELLAHIMEDQNKVIVSPTSPGHVDFSADAINPGITKQVLKTEVRSLLAQLRNLKSTNDNGNHSAAHQTTLRSLKRTLTERTKALESLQGKYRLLDNQKRRLEEKYQSISAVAADCHRRHIPMETEILELRENFESLKKERTDYDEAQKRFAAEKQRFISIIARYREELDLAQYQNESARLEVIQCNNQIAELKKRAAEAKASSSAVNGRVKELQDVQDAMVALMKEAQDTKDVRTVRRNLADLGEKRSRLVGRIANLLTRTRHSPSYHNGLPGHEESREIETSRSNTAGKNRRTSPLSADLLSTDFRNSASSGDLLASSPAPAPSEQVSRKPILDGLRRIGTELTHAKSHKAQRKTILATVEKSCAAIENDTALREVIELKEKELERMEGELLNAKEKAAALEKSLQKERHRKRVEARPSHKPSPRSSPNAKKKQSKKESEGGLKFSRRKSLFGWQAAESDSGDDSNPFAGTEHRDDDNSDS